MSRHEILTLRHIPRSDVSRICVFAFNARASGGGELNSECLAKADRRGGMGASQPFRDGVCVWNGVIKAAPAVNYLIRSRC